MELIKELRTKEKVLIKLCPFVINVFVIKIHNLNLNMHGFVSCLIFPSLFHFQDSNLIVYDIHGGIA